MGTLREQLYQKLLEIEEIRRCSICLEEIKTNVVLCLNGHGVCNSCKYDVQQCPTCTEKFNSSQRNIFINQLLEALPRLCQYSSQGCKFTTLDEEHEKCCNFRPIKCEYRGIIKICDWTGLAMDLIDHIRSYHTLTEHPYNQAKDLCYNDFRGISLRQYYHLLDNNNLFLLFSKKDEENKKFIQVVKHIPTNNEIGPTYYFSISFGKNGDSRWEIKQVLKATPMLDGDERLEDSQHSMVTPLKYLKYFINTYGDLEVSFQGFKK